MHIPNWSHCSKCGYMLFGTTSCSNKLRSAAQLVVVAVESDVECHLLECIGGPNTLAALTGATVAGDAALFA
jgi:hypothetical protein